MEITFTQHPNNRCLYLIDLDIGSSILDELKNENWVSITPTHYDEYYTKRYRIDGNILGKTSKELYDYMSSTEIKSKLLDVVWNNIMFQHKWGPRLDKERLNRITITEFGYNKDEPGFMTDLHLENRCQIAFGMIFFLEEDDPLRSTYFYSDSQKSNPIRIPTGMGKGWLCINTHEGWHNGSNSSNKDRYSCGLNYTFDIFTGGHVSPDDYTIKTIRADQPKLAQSSF